jgi:hypothetical protein
MMRVQLLGVSALLCWVCGQISFSYVLFFSGRLVSKNTAVIEPRLHELLENVLLGFEYYPGLIPTRYAQQVVEIINHAPEAAVNHIGRIFSSFIPQLQRASDPVLLFFALFWTVWVSW